MTEEFFCHVRNVPTDITEEEVRKYTRSAAITGCERLTYWNIAEQKAFPCSTMKITFRSNKVPEEIFCYYAAFRVSPFTPKPLFCHK